MRRLKTPPADIEVDGVPFEVYGKALLPFAPPDQHLTISTASSIRALRSTNCVMLRYTDKFDTPGPTNFWHVINDRFVPLEDRQGPRRRKIRRGLERFSVEKVLLGEVLAQGYPVYQAAQAGYGKPALPQELWSAGVRSVARRKEYWLVHDRRTGRPMAYCAALVFDRSCVYSALKYDPAGFSDYLSYALIYSLDYHYLVERGQRFVSDGERTMSHETSVHDFLVRELGFRRAYCRLNVIFTPLAGLIARTGAFALNHRLPLPGPVALLARHHLLASGAD